ncbi:DUF4369 domain-containing protein [Wenyingzhuangia sp. IMCC45533]
MKNYIWILLVAVLIVSCSQSNQHNFTVNCYIKGLKKGTIYLEKIENGTLVVVDSIFINNATENITFNNRIQEPEIFILSLEKSNSKQVSFFGESGTINVTTELKNFYTKAKITGSETQVLLEKHDEYVKKFNDKNLDLIKLQFEAEKQNDTETSESIEFERNQNLKKSYLFSANYAIAHKDKVIAPFIAYSRMPKATKSLKSKIYDALALDIKESKYGKLLKESIY